MNMYRFEAYLDFLGTGDENLAMWSFNILQNIFTQSWHNRPGTPNQELSFHEVSAGTYRANMFLTEQLAMSAFNLLSDHNVAGRTREVTSLRTQEASFLKVHRCHHDENPPQRCNQDPITAEWSRLGN